MSVLSYPPGWRPLGLVALAFCLPLTSPRAQVIHPLRQLVASDPGPLEEYGFRVDIDGDLAVVSAPYDNSIGAVYVYRRQGTAWQEEAKLVSADASTTDWFGTAVAISGTTIVVGAADSEINHIPTGSAYIFDEVGGVWTQTAKLGALDSQAGDLFGYAVDIDGDRVVIGASGDDDSGNASGSAYVFDRIAGVWQQRQKLLGSGLGQLDLFGSAVAVHQDQILVGAPQHPLVAGMASVHYFRRLGPFWLEEQVVERLSRSRFGTSVDILGSTAAIGSPGWGVGGGVELHEFDGSQWQVDTIVTGEDVAGSDLLGAAVCLGPDRLLVGAAFHDGIAIDGGAAYLFARTAGAWSQRAQMLTAVGQQGETMGNSVALSGDHALVGAYQNNHMGGLTGAAYLFDGDPFVTDTSPRLAAIGTAVTLSIEGGLPSRPALLFLFRVNGFDFVRPLVPTLLDAAGSASLYGIVPVNEPSLPGLTIDLCTFTLDAQGKLRSSNLSPISFY